MSKMEAVFCSMYTQAKAIAGVCICTELPMSTLHALLKEQTSLTAAAQHNHGGAGRLFLILKTGKLEL